MLVLARIAVRLLPSAAVVGWAEKPPRRIRRFAVDEIDWVLWGIDRVAALPWMNVPRLPQALAAHAMLRRRGIASRLCLGGGDETTTSAWLVVGEDDVTETSAPHELPRLAPFDGPALMPPRADCS